MVKYRAAADIMTGTREAQDFDYKVVTVCRGSVEQYAFAIITTVLRLIFDVFVAGSSCVSLKDCL